MGEPAVRNTLRLQRAMRDLTQADLAERAGMTRASVNAIEGGRMVPSIFLALKLARALTVSVDDLTFTARLFFNETEEVVHGSAQARPCVDRIRGRPLQSR